MRMRRFSAPRGVAPSAPLDAAATPARSAVLALAGGARSGGGDLAPRRRQGHAGHWPARGTDPRGAFSAPLPGAAEPVHAAANADPPRSIWPRRQRAAGGSAAAAPAGGATHKAAPAAARAVASALVIPILIAAVSSLAAYLLYRLVIYDMTCARSVRATLRHHGIPKTPLQIIQEFHRAAGRPIGRKEAARLEKEYRQNDPDKFLAMYDAIRERGGSGGGQ